MKKNFSGAFFLAGLLALVTGCGSDDPYNKLSGTAATGAPMTGVVTVVGANGVTATTTIGAGGVFNVETTALTFPAMVRADNGSGTVLFSWAASADTNVNITPLTTTALVLTGLSDDLAAVFGSWRTNAPLLSLPALRDAQKIVNANLQAQFTANNIPYQTYDFFNTVFSTNRAGIDAVLDGLNFQFTFNNDDCENSDNDRPCLDGVFGITVAGSGQRLLFNTNMSTAGVTVGNSPLVATSGSVTWTENDKATVQTSSTANFYARENILIVSNGDSTVIRIKLDGSTPGVYSLGGDTDNSIQYMVRNYFAPVEPLTPAHNESPYIVSSYFYPRVGTVTITSNVNSKISGTFQGTGSNDDDFKYRNGGYNNVTVIAGVFTDIPFFPEIEILAYD